MTARAMSRATTLSLAAALLCACGDPSGNETDGDSTSTGGEPTTGGTTEPVELDMSPVEFVCEAGDAPSDAFIDCVESFAPFGATFGHDLLPEVVLGPPVGRGVENGSVDVVSLGCDGTITVFFDDPGLVDGPGPDFIVFENPFVAGSITFVEPAQVLVSEDGVTWKVFPCDLSAELPRGCAGVTPVLSSPDNGIDPTDPGAAGGDAFDLADVGLSSARYVRLVDVGVAFYGDSTWCGGVGGGFDLDAIAALHSG
ncbi:cell surface protein [Nannocystis bainbridge]|uniref:Cell surface protein n=1 Tax=Nannocystis bainbridge TaxID=2995303 RepID=A0ABT5E5C6_9BACT|nr:cell surface protein [Nannocystis bainbridge]MDC0720915.1 cell surface protein [Nannocystis bainbridge]